MNSPRGSMPVRPSAATVAASNDPLFMVGNGDYTAVTRSNAFEVSYNGHSTVYGTNGSGTVNPSITGATYTDNVIYAWGDISAAGGINSDFGVGGVTYVGPGIYDIRINITDPLGNPVTLMQGSVTATLQEDAGGTEGCGMITTTPIGAVAPNTFRIRTYNLAGDIGCLAADRAFMFKVTGR